MKMDTAASYFNENYNRDIKIEEYAASKGMSVSWFIRNFKKSTGTTPMQFITSIRITNAQMLLETTNYAVNEIARIVGYDNPLYFSRLFHKQNKGAVLIAIRISKPKGSIRCRLGILQHRKVSSRYFPYFPSIVVPFFHL